MDSNNIQQLKAKLAGKINVVTIKNFKADGPRKGATSYKQKDGQQRFCLESSQVVKQGGYIRHDVRTGFASLPADLYKLLKEDLTEGTSWNDVMLALEFKPVAVYFQNSLKPFYKGQEPVRYMNKSNEWVNALNSDGLEFFRSPVVRDVGTYQDTWGTVIEGADGKSRFVRNDNSVVEEVASKEEVEASTKEKDPEETV